MFIIGEITKVCHMIKQVLLMTIKRKPKNDITIYVGSLNQVYFSLLVKLLLPFHNMYLCLRRVYIQCLFWNNVWKKNYENHQH